MEALALRAGASSETVVLAPGPLADAYRATLARHVSPCPTLVPRVTDARATWCSLPPPTPRPRRGCSGRSARHWARCRKPTARVRPSAVLICALLSRPHASLATRGEVQSDCVDSNSTHGCALHGTNSRFGKVDFSQIVYRRNLRKVPCLCSTQCAKAEGAEHAAPRHATPQ